MERVWCIFNEWFLAEDEFDTEPHRDFLAVCRDRETALKMALNYAEESLLDEDDEITPFKDGYSVSCSNPDSYDLYVIETRALFIKKER